MANQTPEEQARELADHCRYCDMPDYRPRCKEDYEQQVKDIAALIGERDQVRQRIGTLEHGYDELRTICNRVQSERDQLKRRVAELERENAYCKKLALELDDKDGKRLAAAKIEGLRQALEVAERFECALIQEGCTGASLIRNAIRAEIAKLEGK